MNLLKSKINILGTFTLAALLIGSCATSNTKAVSQVDGYEKIAEERFGESAKYEHSPDEQYVLCYAEERGTAKQPQNTITYFVYDLKKEAIVHEDTFGPGSIKWYDDNKLEIFMIPGMMPANKTKEDFTYIYNVETKKKASKSDFENKQ